MRDHHRRKDRTPSKPPFEIDILVPGLGAITGRGDRFRCSAETRNAKVLRERRRMVEDLGQRLLHDILAARLERRFTTAQLATAYKRGPEALRVLLDDSRRCTLVSLRDRWMGVCAARSRRDYLRQVNAFIDFCGGAGSATVADLSTEKIAAWLHSLTDRRLGRSGAPIKSIHPEATAARKRRAKKRAERVATRVSAGTRNRYRTAVSAFCTFAVNVAGALSVHPLKNGRLPSLPEPHGRMPSLDPASWSRYCTHMAADPAAPVGSVHVARLLRHTGADVGELLGYHGSDGAWISGILARDVLGERKLPRVRLKRQKVDNSPPRLVPYPSHLMLELQAYISSRDIRPGDPIFLGVNRREFEAAHRRARNFINQPWLRLKDFRHLAAISWAQGAVRLERIKEWLGHSTIRLTEVYTRFAPDDALDEVAALRAAELAEGAVPNRAGEISIAGQNRGKGADTESATLQAGPLASPDVSPHPRRAGSANPSKSLGNQRRGPESNRRIAVLQTAALPLGYRAVTAT